MKLKILSDLHLNNFGYTDIPSNDPDTILIVAGDVSSYYGPKSMANEFFADVSAHYRLVLYVPGNHEFYGGKITNVCPFDLPDNVKLLDNDTYQLDGYNFIGSTLWTSFGNNPIVELQCKAGIADFTHIHNRTDSGCISINDVKLIHDDDVNFIKSSIVDNTKTIVITHYAPSYQSCAPQYKFESTNAAFMTDMDSTIIELAPVLWVHGHTHANADYTIDSTRVICNPRGYGNENKGFDPEFEIELDD